MVSASKVAALTLVAMSPAAEAFAPSAVPGLALRGSNTGMGGLALKNSARACVRGGRGPMMSLLEPGKEGFDRSGPHTLDILPFHVGAERLAIHVAAPGHNDELDVSHWRPPSPSEKLVPTFPSLPPPPARPQRHEEAQEAGEGGRRLRRHGPGRPRGGTQGRHCGHTLEGGQGAGEQQEQDNEEARHGSGRGR